MPFPFAQLPLPSIKQRWCYGITEYAVPSYGSRIQWLGLLAFMLCLGAEIKVMGNHKYWIKPNTCKTKRQFRSQEGEDGYRDQ